LVLIEGWSLRARETVETETPDSFARSSSVVLLLLPLPIASRYCQENHVLTLMHIEGKPLQGKRQDFTRRDLERRGTRAA
jgi:hypothetical protein